VDVQWKNVFKKEYVIKIIDELAQHGLIFEESKLCYSYSN
jgi:hypothetical protein